MSDDGNFQSFGNSDGPANEFAMNKVSEIINEIQPGAMVTKFVLLVETIDNEDRWMSGFTAPSMKRWDTLGLLEWGKTMEVWTSFEREDLDGPEPDDGDTG